MRPWLTVLAAVGVAALVDGGGAGRLRSDTPTASKPPWQRLLQGDEAKKAHELEERSVAAWEASKWEEALRAAEQVLELRQKRQGKGHWEAVDALWEVRAFRTAQRQPAKMQEQYAGLPALQQEAAALEVRGRYGEAQPQRQKALAICLEMFGEEHPHTAIRYTALATNLNGQGKYAAAEEGFRTALGILRKVLGPDHPATATAWNNLAGHLNGQGKYAEAEEVNRRALAIRLEVLGEEHPHTASSYTNLAMSLQGLGRLGAAEQHNRKALAICRKTLGEEHPQTATSYNNLGGNLNAQGKYAEAEEVMRKALAIRRKVFGEEHPSTASSCTSLAISLQGLGRFGAAEQHNRKALAIYRKMVGEHHPETATAWNNLAVSLNEQGKYAEAEEVIRKALAIRLEVLGKDHPHMANSYNNLAGSLEGQGQFAKAEDCFRQALEINRKALGDNNPTTVLTYHNLALNLSLQGKYALAEAAARQVLAIRRQVLGEEHPYTASSYAVVANTLQGQGQYAAAEEGFRKVLDIYRKVLGEEHPLTATSYHNLALNLNNQGKYAEAEEVIRRALAIRRKVLGEEHPHTVSSYNNHAISLQGLGRFADAEERYRQALDISQKVFGEHHLVTATSYSNVAVSLNDQGKYGEAEELNRKALAIRLEVLGKDHPHTATSYHNLAACFQGQGQFAAAEQSYRKALDIQCKVLGEEQAPTVATCHALALVLQAQGKYAEAEQALLRAAASFALARTRLAHSGLERATFTSERSPLQSLAALLVRNGKPALAWSRYEESLSRGTWDDLSARLRRPAAEQVRQATLVARLDRLDQFIEKALAIQDETAQQKQQREDLLGQRRLAQEELNAFIAHLEKTYGPAAGEVFAISRIQASLADHTALVGWLDLPSAGPKAADPNGEHWAFLLRSKGDPICIRLKGSGTAGAWTAADSSLPADLLLGLREPRPGWERLAQRMHRQRLLPLRQHLAAGDGLPAVRHLLVLPSVGLAGLPVELFATEYTVSYTLSGTLHVHLRKQPAVKSAGLLALGDPVFETGAAVPKESPLPPGGVLLTLVQPGSNAAQSSLRPDDVLLKYGGRDITTLKDLQEAIAAADGKGDLTVQVWRDGKVLSRRVPPGKLGVVLATEAAPRALAERNRLDRRLSLRSGDDGCSPLPGTRVEVESLQRLFPAEPKPLLLLDSEASEQKLDAIAAAGELGKYRYLHLATHGEVDNSRALRSAIVLSRDTLPDPQQQLLAGKPVYDGRLTAEEMLRTWNLEAELVTMSACETALGKYERGEGFVGFAQALILCGSRSVCLSLWKVDDAATALLMQRFYANLLGKRDGLKSPLPKAEALAEAKQWLRTLPREQALKHAATVYQGIERGKGRPKLPVVPDLPKPTTETKEDCPYAHPYYWAAFILTGDPD
jgi:tetratricopeptide (TPR) repeat protein